MSTYARDNWDGLVYEIMDEWAGWYVGDFGVHSQVFMDMETGELWQETNGANGWASFADGYNYVEVADLRRPDDFGELEYMDVVVSEIADEINAGLYR